MRTRTAAVHVCAETDRVRTGEDRIDGLTDPTGATRMNAVSEALKRTAIDPSIKVDGKRLWNSLMEMAKIGATPKGGVCRLALTDLDKAGRDLIVR